MRTLGTRVSLETIRFDLVFLHASLTADERAEIQALAPAVESLMARFRQEREAIEAAQDAAVIMTAKRGRSDDVLDRLVISFGGIVRAVNRKLYGLLFPRLSPTQTARIALDREIAEVTRMTGILGDLPADDPLRAAHEPRLKAAVLALEAARKQTDAVDVGLAVARSRLDQFKHDVDKGRTEIFGKLVVLTGSKSEASEFFRQESSSPEHEDEPTPSPAPAS